MEGRPKVLIADLPGTWRNAVATGLTTAGCELGLTDDRRELRRVLDAPEPLYRVVVVGHMRQLNIGIGEPRKVELDALFPPDAPRPPRQPHVFLINPRQPDKVLASRMRARGVDSFLAREDPVAKSCTAILNVAFESRIHKRVALNTEVRVTLGNAHYKGTLSDLSEGGAEVSVGGGSVLALHDIVRLSFGFGGVQITCAAEVRRVSERGRLLWKRRIAGVRFTDVDEATRAALIRVLDAAAAQSLT